MKKAEPGWTMVELLASMAVLGVMLVLMSQALAMTQRSWISSRATAERQRTLELVQSTLTRHLRLATLQPRSRFDETTGSDLPESDLHFVCGPAATLLPSVPGICGDAVFFQHPGHEGALSSALQGCGFYLQYADDVAWRPSWVKPQKRFRLMQFHQSAPALTLFRQPTLSAHLQRRDLYAWFTAPIIGSSIGSHSVVAENVIGLLIKPQGYESRHYDTRRHQWEEASATSRASQHRLPQALSLYLLVTDEASWSKLSPAAADALAHALIQTDARQAPNANNSSPLSLFASQRALLAAYQLGTQVLTVEINF